MSRVQPIANVLYLFYLSINNKQTNKTMKWRKSTKELPKVTIPTEPSDFIEDDYGCSELCLFKSSVNDHLFDYLTGWFTTSTFDGVKHEKWVDALGNYYDPVSVEEWIYMSEVETLINKQQ